jgi:hypothetical protein
MIGSKSPEEHTEPRMARVKVKQLWLEAQHLRHADNTLWEAK